MARNYSESLLLPLWILIFACIAPDTFSLDGDGSYKIKDDSKNKAGTNLSINHHRGLGLTDEEKCVSYCNLYLAALDRCMYPVDGAPDNKEDCVLSCLQAPFSKDASELSFEGDSLQCRANHAIVGIKEGALTNSPHCYHASLYGTARCDNSIEQNELKARLDIGRSILYYPSVLLGVGTSQEDMVTRYILTVQFLMITRGRLYTRYPYLDLTKEGDGIKCDKTDLRYRSADGSCNSVNMPLMGAKDTPFTRNLQGSEPHSKGYADIKKVAEVIKRPHPSKGSEKLAPFNQLAVAWIQFMTHDWFQHDKDEEPGGGMHNRVTHWWDASQIYGSTVEEVEKLRVEGGKIHLDTNAELDYDKKNIPITGFVDNFWVGLHIMHTIFAREHNYIVDELERLGPGQLTADEKYGTARLCVSAILAKIHTLEWTPTLLDNPVSTFGLNANWYGLNRTVNSIFSQDELEPYQELLQEIKAPSVLEGEFPTDLTLFNTSFFMTEEFVSVYRMHPLLPDEIRVGNETMKLGRITFRDARKLIPDKTTRTFLEAFAQTPARALSLSNYPRQLYNLRIGNRQKINLAEIDLQRDRERNLPRYNDARRQLFLEPYSSLDDLTDDKDEQSLLKSVYDDIEQVDFMVGCLVDKERPEGFAFGVVPFFIFIVMAARRLMSDRFFQEGLNAENYTPWGLNYVNTNNFNTILERHFPDLQGTIPENPFSNDWSF